MKNNEEKTKSTKKTTVKNANSSSTKKNTSTTTKKSTTAKKNVTTKEVAKTSISKATNNSTKKNTKPVSKTTTKKTEIKKVAKPEVKKEKKVVPVEVKTKEEIKKLETKTEEFVTPTDFKKISAILLVIVCAFGIFFVASKYFDKKDNSDIFKEDLEIAEIQYDDILISKMLKQEQTEYYVLIEYSKDKNLETYKGYVSSYKTNYKDVTKIYTAQLDNAFNKSYYGETDNYELENLSFTQTTLVKVNGGNITETYVGSEISKKIQGLIEAASN